MNPSYKVQLDICVRAPIEDASIWVRRIQYLCFVPRAGDTLRLESEPQTADDEVTTLDVTLESCVWDMAQGMFVCENVDETASDAYAAGDGDTTKAVAKAYEPYGFNRINFPTVQVPR